MNPWCEKTAFALYQCLMHLAWPLARWRYRRRSRAEPLYGQGLAQRLARYDAPARPGALWIHAVSLGETRAVAPLLALLRAQNPGLRVLLTHATATGWEAGQALLRPGDLQAWLPWDTAGAAARFLRQFRPAAGLLVETEVWPALARACRHEAVPLLLINARLSERSLRRAQRLACLARPAYRALTAVHAQTPDDATRLRSLGAPVAGVTGNLKYDLSPDAAQLARGAGWRATARGRPVWMLASSREGEEDTWLAAWLAIRARWPDVLWLLVPRHPQRFDAVAQQVQGAGLVLARRSAWGDGPAPGDAGADVWLGDSVGEMHAYYALADVALLGGSYAPLGGQNLIEAAACGCPVVMGPHTFNFAAAADAALAHGAALRVDDMPQALQALGHLAASPRELQALREACVSWLAEGRGAVARTAEAVWRHIPRGPSNLGTSS